MAKRILTLFWLALLTGFPIIASADGGGTSSGEAVSTVIGMLFNVPSQMVISAPFAPVGKMLLSALLTILFSWRMVRVVLDGAGINQVIGELVNIVLLYGIAGLFMTSTVQNELADGFDKLATMASSATAGSMGTSGTSAQSQLTNNLMQMIKAAYQLYEGSPPSDSTGSFWGSVWSSLKTFDFITAFANLLFRFFIAVLIICAALIYCMNLVMSQMMVNIAQSVGRNAMAQLKAGAAAARQRFGGASASTGSSSGASAAPTSGAGSAPTSGSAGGAAKAPSSGNGGSAPPRLPNSSSKP